MSKPTQPTDPLLGLSVLSLRVFSALFEEQSVTKASAKLFLTPSAVSHSLRKLRELLDDELFVREGGAMIPTARAVQIAPQLDEILHRLRSALRSDAFDPAAGGHTFSVASLPYSAWLFMTEVTERLMVRAPSAALRVYSLDHEVIRFLEDGTLDVAIGTFPRIPAHIERKTLMRDRIVWVMRNSNPRAGEILTPDVLGTVEHLLVNIEKPKKSLAPSGRNFEHFVTLDDAGALQDTFAAAGIKPRIRAIVPDIPSGLALVARTDLVMATPLQIAQDFASLYDLKVVEAPFMAGDIEIQMLWHRDHGRRPSTMWLRELMGEVARSRSYDQLCPGSTNTVPGDKNESCSA